MLETLGISLRFGGLEVLRDVSLTLEAGQVTGLIGPNGAGKTTLFDCITGFVKRDAGSVMIDGRALTRAAPHRVSASGIARTFQTPRMFDGLTTMENLVVAGSAPSALRAFVTAFRAKAQKAEMRRLVAIATENAEFMGLGPVLQHRADALSGGQRKLLEMGRALMRNPRVLLLDEPIAGVHPTLARTIASKMHEIARRGVAVGVIEHNMDFVMNHCQYIYVLAEGAELARGKPELIRRDPRVLEAYLGTNL